MKKQVRFSLLSVATKTVDLLWELLKSWRVFLCYAGLLTVVTLFFGRWSYSCEAATDGFWCYHLPQNTFFLIGYAISYYAINLLLYCLFVNDYYKCSYKNSVFKWCEVLKVGKQSWKSVLFLFVCLAVFIMPMIIAYKILLKPANPNWFIEFIYFIIMFIMVFVPIIFIRLSSFMAYFLQNQVMPPLKSIWQNTAGKTYVNIIIFLLLMLFVNILLLRSMGYLSAFTHRYNNFAAVIGGEFADNLLKLLCVAVMICFCRAQYEVLEKINSQAVQEEPAAAAANDVVTTKKAPKSAAPKRKKAAPKKKRR